MELCFLCEVRWKRIQGESERSFGTLQFVGVTTASANSLSTLLFDVASNVGGVYAYSGKVKSTSAPLVIPLRGMNEFVDCRCYV